MIADTPLSIHRQADVDEASFYARDPAVRKRRSKTERHNGAYIAPVPAIRLPARHPFGDDLGRGDVTEDAAGQAMDVLAALKAILGRACAEADCSGKVLRRAPDARRTCMRP